MITHNTNPSATSSCTSKRSSSAGHTLLEMTIVVAIMSVLVSMVARAQRPFSEMILELQDRSVTASELHLAVDYLSKDFGAAEKVDRRSEDSLWIRREPSAARRLGVLAPQVDRGIQYSYKDGNLLRKDLETGGSFVVATGMTGFDVSRLRNKEMRITMADGVGEEQHEVALVWRKR
jgi:prepilin-type N-terminal cleavage/methylation domain-containing protein